jgi:hypothetical protein
MRSAKCSLGKFLAWLSQSRNSSEGNSERTAVIVHCRNEERSEACGVAAKGRQRTMTASLRGKAKSLSFWREEPRRGRPEGENSMSLRDGREQSSIAAHMHDLRV